VPKSGSASTHPRHWSDWGDHSGWDSDDWYADAYSKGVPFGGGYQAKLKAKYGKPEEKSEEKPQLPPGYEQIAMADLLDNQKLTDKDADPFDLFEDEVALSKKILDSEVVTMAWLGFKIQYTMSWAPKDCVAWLEKMGHTDVDPDDTFIMEHGA
jgi:hypothetical protein